LPWCVEGVYVTENRGERKCGRRVNVRLVVLPMKDTLRGGILQGLKDSHG
jgi:hypothetical protein